MEISKKELELVRQIEMENKQELKFELADLQLALIGGGSTVDSFH